MWTFRFSALFADRDTVGPRKHMEDLMIETLTRRQLLFMAGAVVAAPTRRLAAQAGAPRAIATRTLNHLHLIVSNLQRSLDFYQRLFGMPLAGMQGVESDWRKPVIPILAIGSGPQFISLSEGSGRSGGRDRIDHFGFGMNRFSAEAVVKMLAAHGVKADVRMRGDSTPPVAELKFTDPDNITIQIQDPSYCGGAGALGNKCRQQRAPKVAGPPPIPVQTLNHFTLTVSDVERSVAFYERVLGMRLQAMQATEADWSKPVIPVLGIGGGPQFIAFGRGGSAAATTGRIDHFCLGMPGFRADTVVKMLADHGLTGNVRKRADRQPPSEELMFSDPDGIRVQIQDVGYCGGTGVLGDRCGPGQ